MPAKLIGNVTLENPGITCSPSISEARIHPKSLTSASISINPRLKLQFNDWKFSQYGSSKDTKSLIQVPSELKLFIFTPALSINHPPAVYPELDPNENLNFTC